MVLTKRHLIPQQDTLDELYRMHVQGSGPNSIGLPVSPCTFLKQDTSNLLIAGVCAQRVSSSPSQSGTQRRWQHLLLNRLLRLQFSFVETVKIRRVIFHHHFVERCYDLGEVWDLPTENVTQSEEQLQLCPVCGLLESRMTSVALSEIARFPSFTGDRGSLFYRWGRSISSASTISRHHCISQRLNRDEKDDRKTTSKILRCHENRQEQLVTRPSIPSRSLRAATCLGRSLYRMAYK